MPFETQIKELKNKLKINALLKKINFLPFNILNIQFNQIIELKCLMSFTKRRIIHKMLSLIFGWNNFLSYFNDLPIENNT